jgi:homogentisate 1,2-dioxygenase
MLLTHLLSYLPAATRHDTPRYILEIYGGHFTIPDLGPIGANGLANSRDFLTPKACFEDSEQQDYSLVNKFSGEWFVSR